MKKTVFVVILTTLISFAVYGQSLKADLILYHGKIFTSELNEPFAEAVAIRGDRILAVGSDDTVTKLVGTKTRLIDLQGRTVIPGVNDAHFHFMPDPHGYNLRFKTVEPTWEETISAIKDAVQQTPKGQWIFGQVGYDVLKEKGADRFMLDRIAPDHPVLLRSFYGHGYIVNSKAMPLLSIYENEPDPMGGYYERVNDSQRINGRFWEYAEWKTNRVLVGQVSDADAISELKNLSGEAVRLGITSMQIMPSMPIDRFVRVLIKANLPIRIRAIPFASTSPAARDISEFSKLPRLNDPDSKVKASGIKWILDGTPYERGAALRQPYGDMPDYTGKLNFSESEIVKMVRESLAFNQQLLFHCAGDRSAEAVLDALEKVGGGKIDWRQKRVRIEHGDGVTADLIERAKKLGVIVVLNPSHFSIVDIIYARYSPATRFFSARSLLDAGIPIAFGSDGPMNPFLNVMFAAIHPVRPTEALTREQSVRAYTNGSAYAEFAENDKGTLTKGKLADISVLSQDLFTTPVPELPNTESVLTIVGGKIVYDPKVLK